MSGEKSDEFSSDRSVVRECYWVLCGQFSDSEAEEDEIKSGFIAIAVATGTLSLTAAVSALLTSMQNWRVAVLLGLLGLESLLFAWFTGLHHLDRILIDD